MAHQRDRPHPRIGWRQLPARHLDQQTAQPVEHGAHDPVVDAVERLGRIGLFAHDKPRHRLGFVVEHDQRHTADQRVDGRARLGNAARLSAKRCGLGQHGRDMAMQVRGNVIRRREVQPLFATEVIGDRRHQRVGIARNRPRARPFESQSAKVVDRNIEQTGIGGGRGHAPFSFIRMN